MLAVPLINLCLQLVAALQQGSVARAEFVEHVAQAIPEFGSTDTRAWRGFLLDEIVEELGYLQVAGGNDIGHAGLVITAQKQATILHSYAAEIPM